MQARSGKARPRDATTSRTRGAAQPKLGPDLLALVQATIWTILATGWWLALDTVVDTHGVRTSGRWLRERIEWRQVQRFAVDPVSGKPVLVLVGGRRRRLAYVPDAAWEQIQLRWQQAVGQESRTGAARPYQRTT
jgi:hypothetical protein